MTSMRQRFEWLVKTYSQDLYRYAYWLCRHTAVAEDLVQETMLRAWKNIDSLQDLTASRAWLLTILRNENARRFERRQFEYTEMDIDAEISTTTHSPEHQFSEQQLTQLLFRLSADYREPLVLQLLFGMTGDEIASTLSLNLNTVNTRLFRARAQMKKLLEPHMSISESQHG